MICRWGGELNRRKGLDAFVLLQRDDPCRSGCQLVSGSSISLVCRDCMYRYDSLLARIWERLRAVCAVKVGLVRIVVERGNTCESFVVFGRCGGRETGTGTGTDTGTGTEYRYLRMQRQVRSSTLRCGMENEINGHRKVYRRSRKVSFMYSYLPIAASSFVRSDSKGLPASSPCRAEYRLVLVLHLSWLPVLSMSAAIFEVSDSPRFRYS
ncbi:hypothetical protein J3F83DRAFT_694167 [Trichoderma novae-zelandiae]